ncbi:hypothetical protein ZIOFF_073455 [Zingiber officinale]|uniref:Uncharacterized protein n=1 Tax=Zingiber officinale TaxID=94328 RepID=A0A8J5ETR9_ZINOF|nr:hypothetical protein ZIOFF_073455 [Zingiber officinale]
MGFSSPIINRNPNPQGIDLTPQALSFASRSSGADPSSPRQLHSSTAPGVVPQIESLPLFRDVPVLERQALFLHKLQICSMLFDFSDMLKSAREKEVKRQTLSELIDFVQSGSGRLNEQVQEELVRTVDINIFRSLPPASHENTGIEPTDPEEEDPYRFQNCLREIRKLVRDVEDVDKGVLIKKEDWHKLHVHIASYNNFPTTAGLASSAAGFACLGRDQVARVVVCMVVLLNGRWVMMLAEVIALQFPLPQNLIGMILLLSLLCPRLKEHMEYCINHPEEMSKLSKLKAHITEVKGIMMDNIEKVSYYTVIPCCANKDLDFFDRMIMT